VRWLSNYGRPVRDEAQGRVIRIYSASKDITERKQAEERVRREAERAEALARVAARLNAQLDLDTVLNTVCEETAHALGVPVVSVMLYEPDRQTFRLAGIYGLPPEIREQLTPVPQSLYEEYHEQKGPLIVIPDLPSLPNVEFYARYNIRTTVAASMVREEKLVGTLNVHSVGDVRAFDDDELVLLKGLADQAAQAIANAQLFEQVKQQREQLRTLAVRLAETEEAERRRLARELHDRVGQSLTALSINLNIIRSQLPADSPQATARLDGSLRLVEETVEHTRDVMAELRPSVLDDYGLLAALRWYARQSSNTLGVAVQVEGEELSPRLPPAVETALFRIAQEALNNVTKHAHATQASVRLEAVADMACLTIADDGVGFDPAAKRRPGELPYWGLITMKERAEAVGGRLRVESAPGQGTHITVEGPR
jgi:signal transduction histidine kinase